MEIPDDLICWQSLLVKDSFTYWEWRIYEKGHCLVSFDLPDEIRDGTGQNVGDFYLHVVTYAIEGLQTGVRNILRHPVLGVQGRDFVLIGRHD